MQPAPLHRGCAGNNGPRRRPAPARTHPGRAAHRTPQQWNGARHPQARAPHAAPRPTPRPAPCAAPGERAPACPQAAKCDARNARARPKADYVQATPPVRTVCAAAPRRRLAALQQVASRQQTRPHKMQTRIRRAACGKCQYTATYRPLRQTHPPRKGAEEWHGLAFALAPDFHVQLFELAVQVGALQPGFLGHACH